MKEQEEFPRASDDFSPLHTFLPFLPTHCQDYRLTCLSGIWSRSINCVHALENYPPAHWVDSEHPLRSLTCGGVWSQLAALCSCAEEQLGPQDLLLIPDLCHDPWQQVQVCFVCQECWVDQVERDSQCQESDS